MHIGMSSVVKKPHVALAASACAVECWHCSNLRFRHICTLLVPLNTDDGGQHCAAQLLLVQLGLTDL